MNLFKRRTKVDIVRDYYKRHVIILPRRDYFAALAMQTMIPHEIGLSYAEVAKNAVIMADVLINELNKKPHEKD